jgi:hypothetical protein
VFGNAVSGTNQLLETLFTTFNRPTRTIYAECAIDLDSGIYASGDVPYAPIFRVLGNRALGLNEGFSLNVDDSAGPGNDILLKVSTNYIGPGSGLNQVTIATIPRASWAGQTKVIRLEVRLSTPVDPADDQNFDHNADGVVRVLIDGVEVYENVGVNVVMTASGLATMPEAYTVGGIALGDSGFAGSYRYIDFGYCDPGEGEPPDPSGAGGEGTNPDFVPELPGDVPEVFIYMRPASDEYPDTGFDPRVVVAEQIHGTLPDRPGYFGGKKAGRILTISRVRRELSVDGSFRAYNWTVELRDDDHFFRDASNNGTLLGSMGWHYVVGHATRLAEGQPLRWATGVVTSHEPMAGLMYRLEFTGKLSELLSSLGQPTQVPPYRLNKRDAPGMDPTLDGQHIQVAIGDLQDETIWAGSTTPQGVVPLRYLGWTPLTHLFPTAITSVEVDEYVISMGAIGWVYDLYYSPIVWGEEEPQQVGDLVQPADDTQFYYECIVAGTTGESEPEWPEGVGATVVDGSVTWRRQDPLDVLRRYVVPPEAYGTILIAPYKPGWAAITGQSAIYTNWTDVGFGNLRWSGVFILRSHRYAKAIREGRIKIGANIIGVMEFPDGTGRYLSQPDQILIWLLRNYVFNSNIGLTTYFDIPTFYAPDGNYSAIDVDTFSQTRALCETFIPGGYVAGLLLARGGSAQSANQVLQEVCEGHGIWMGENIHGQVVAHRENPDIVASVTRFTDYDIKDGSLAMSLDM